MGLTVAAWLAVFLLIGPLIFLFALFLALGWHVGVEVHEYLSNHYWTLRENRDPDRGTFGLGNPE